MSIAEDATLLSASLGRTVYYGYRPDADDGTMDEILELSDFPFHRPEHAFGLPQPLMTPYGVLIYARALTQTDARALCLQGYTALLAMGYLAISPPVSIGQDDNGRFEIVAEVEAHSISQ